jgi:molybdenum-dependent DNA-binding transcriptional regulator ModE
MRGTMPRRALTKQTLSRAREVFLSTLAETGQITKAAKAAGVSRVTPYAWRGADPEFSKAWDAALEKAADMLEDVAIERAANGVLRPVYQGGVKVGTVREYSDGLMALLLKAHKPEKFRERSEVQLNATLNISEKLQKARERVDGKP